MFFKSDNISCDIQSVLELSWGMRDESSGIRPYAALSFRYNGYTDFLHSSGRTNVTSGDIAFVPAHFQYRQNTKSDEHLICVHFTSTSDLPKNIIKLSPSNPDYFGRKFRELHTAWIKKQTGFEYECKSILYRILMKIELEYAGSKPSSNFDKIEEAVDYIHENYISENITVDSLAKMCGMSDTYFRKLFYNQFSQSPLKYINGLKLSYALELLHSGYYTVSEAADKCSFENVYYFSSYIKSHTGLSPSQHIKNGR